MKHRVLVKALLGAIVALAFASGVARAEEVGVEEPNASAADESKSSIEGTFKEPKERVRLTDMLKDSLKDKPAFLRDLKLNANARTYFLRRDRFDGVTTNQAWAAGGSLGFKSGYLWNTFGIGATYYTSQPLYGPDDEGGTLLLKSDEDQDGYGVTGELYGEIKLGEEVVLDLYRKEVNTPFINRNDNRMTPNTFENYTLVGNHVFESNEAELRYGAGWVSKIKDRNSERFVPMSELAGAPIDRGVAMSGFNYKIGGLTAGLINYYSPDVINIGYGEAKYSKKLDNDIALLGAVQFIDQRSTGDDTLTAGDSFSTNQVGVKVEASRKGLLLGFAFTSVNGNTSLRNPWSSYPGYTSVQFDDFNRAEESAFLTKITYDFSRLGLKGLTTTVLYVYGWGVDQSVGQDEEEWDFDVQWRPSGEQFKGLSFRARRAYVRQRGVDHETLDDYRLIVNYDFAVF